VKTNLTLNDVWGGGQPDGGQRRHLLGAHHGEQIAHYHVLRCGGTR
jgi:hypothetical protein